jgi:hypothetical protein
VRSTDVRYRRASATGTTYTAYTTWKYNTTSRSAMFTGAAGFRYCFSTRSRDYAGNTSGWSAERCATVPVDERSLTRSPTAAWARTSASGWINSTASAATATGARLRTATSVTVRQVGIVAWRGATCGKVDLYIGTTKVGTTSLYKTGTPTRSLILLPRFTTTKTGVVSVRVTSSGKTVKVDGLALTRT